MARWPGGPSRVTAPTAPAPSGEPAGRPGRLLALFAISGAKADEREVSLGTLTGAPLAGAERRYLALIADQRFYGRAFERERAEGGVRLPPPARA